MRGSFAVSNPFGATHRRQRIAFFLAIGLGVTVFLIALIIFGANRFATATQDRSSHSMMLNGLEATMVKLYAPSDEIRAGSKMSEAGTREIFRPHAEVPPDAVRDLDELKGMFARANLQPGTLILRSDLSADPVPVSLPLTPGNRAISIEIDAISGLEGHALPGTRVDVLLAYHDKEKLMTKVVVQNARVLSYGGDTSTNQARLSNDRPQRAMGRTITLDVAPGDALNINTARLMGKLSLTMRAPTDNKGLERIEGSAADLGGSAFDKKEKSGNCSRGRMRVAGKEYMIGCDGEMIALEAP